ncbi:TIGR04282 family arsenosugar biosynthesis glycosyltransferase [Spirulina sp. CCNP1310]|uniref:TIGR04282 family arsenosugar biosynthesis glycosyltransferase n=1 Tax=Spirulina sp. CCNP1310 TaxID=3110249 RepID=UPI002B1F4CE9|nr:TIGR04282 family arsenosugar biosynthesis glycosyltransferase [Spirulina sp. CCNP1310]
MEQLIMMSRYPIAGQTKTRLIPRLGPEGAAQLQQQMTEHTLATVARLQQSRRVRGAIAFTDGDLAQMQAWLGASWDYWPQGEGDLGDRMARAFAHSFSLGASRTVMIGIDCPDLTPALLAAAFDQLATTPVVFGPATDGGYYLIGLAQPYPDLFQSITWGTDQVLAQSRQILNTAAMPFVVLPTLTDVDYPEDLPVWEKYQGDR